MKFKPQIVRLRLNGSSAGVYANTPIKDVFAIQRFVATNRY